MPGRTPCHPCKRHRPRVLIDIAGFKWRLMILIVRAELWRMERMKQSHFGEPSAPECCWEGLALRGNPPDCTWPDHKKIKVQWWFPFPFRCPTLKPVATGQKKYLHFVSFIAFESHWKMPQFCNERVPFEGGKREPGLVTTTPPPFYSFLELGFLSS